MEEWKFIVGYEGIYQVSNLGNIRSVNRLTSHGHKVRGISMKIMKNMFGYSVIQLRSAPNKKRMHKVHRIVAMSFIKESHSMQAVNHRNGNKQDNRVENLEWCTNAENNAHARATGLSKPRGKSK